MNTQNPILKIKLSAAEPVALVSADDAPRTFSGIAYSGKPIGYGGYSVVVDLDGVKFKAKVPVLLEHNPQQMAGVCTLSADSDGLKAEGTLLDNQYGSEIAAAADQGFPWEMSVYAQASSYEELQAGAKAVVNGAEVTGPMTILRGNTIREVSFTAVGVDADTQAVVLSDGAPFKPFEAELSMTKDEQAQFDALKEEVETLKAEKAEALKKLADSEKEAKKAGVKAKLSAAGFTENADGGFEGVSQATLNVLFSASAEDADAMIADLQPKKAAGGIPQVLLSDGHGTAAPETTPQADGVKLSANTVQGVMGSYV